MENQKSEFLSIIGLLLFFCHTTFALDAQTVYTAREIASNAFQVKDSIVVMAISPDGKMLVTGCPSGKPNIALWEVETGKRKHFLPASHHVNGVGFSADGRHVYAMSMGGTEHLEIWNVESGKKTSNFRLFGRGDYVRTCRHDFSPCGKYFLTLEKDSDWVRQSFIGGKMVVTNNPVLGIWDLVAGARMRKFDGFPGQVGRFFPNGKEFIVGSEDGKLLIGAIELGKIKQTLVNGNVAICDIRFSVADDTFIVTDFNGNVSVWSFSKSFEKKSSFNIHGVTVYEKACFLQSDNPFH